MERIVVIDTDAGVDDAAAIFLVLTAHKNPTINLKVVGITCVNGNTNVDNVCKNVTRILQVAGVEDVPIFRGCETAMVVPYDRELSYHGSDGFGNAGLPELEIKIEEEHATMALLRLAKNFAGQLSILALGPLTNLAMASRLDSNFGSCIKEICLMGGNIKAVNNPTFNFKADPEAAYVVLSCFLCKIIVVPYETCKTENLKEFRLNVLAPLATPEMQLLNKIEVESLKKDSWSPCDLLTAAIFIQPRVISDSKNLHITTDLVGYRGQMFIGSDDQRRNASVVYGVNYDVYKKILIEGLGKDQINT